MKPTIYVLHVGKTGGTALKLALLEGQKLKNCTGEQNNIFLYNKHFNRINKIPLSKQKATILLCAHSTSIEDIPVGDKIVIFLRDPITRFVSAFYHRRRMYKNQSEQEKILFSYFRTPNQLAASLSNVCCDKNKLALSALHEIGHIHHLIHWYKSIEYFNSRIDDILFIGFTETLDSDFDKLKKLLNLPSKITLPKDSIGVMKGPTRIREQDKIIQEPGLTFLKEWYKQDIEFVALCKEIMASRTL